MPTKKSKSSTRTSGTRTSATKKTTSVVDSPYSLSRLKESISRNFSLYVVGLLLLVAGFAGGAIWQENVMLKSGTKPSGAAAAPTAPSEAAAPSGPSADQLNTMPKVTSDDHVRGNRRAKVLLVEYSDYECPFCKRFHETMKSITKEYGDDVAWVYRQYPLSSLHANAQKAAEAAECVNKLAGNDAFWSFTDLYFKKTDSSGTGVAIDDMPKVAAEVGVDAAAVKKCMDSGEMTKKVKAQMDGGSKAGVSGTPGTFVVTSDGVQQLIPGALPVDSVKTTIEQYL